MKKDSYYFSHDYNARNDLKMKKLRHKHKMIGIGIYWCLVEILYEEGGKIDLADTPVIADELGVKEVVLNEVINQFGLFENDGKSFWSESVKRRLDKRLEKSETARQSALQRWGNANAMQTHSDRNAIKERKGKEKKGNICMPTIDEVRHYFSEKGYRLDVADRAYEFYASNNWHDSRNNPVLNWKSKMVNNWFKEENKVQAVVKKMVL